MAEQLKRLLSCWPRSDGLRRFTLSFEDPRTELEFARSSKGALTSSLFSLGCLLLVSSLGRLGTWCLSSSASDLAYPEQHHDMLFGWGAVSVSALLLIICCKTGSLVQQTSSRTLECLATAFMMLLMTGAMIGPPHTFARLRGYELPGCAPDIGVFANLVGAVLVSLTLLHIRWHSTIPIQLYALACYSWHVFIHHDNECSHVEHAPTRAMIFLRLIVIVLLSSKGKRDMEVQTRQLFRHVIHEKTHRVQSEFRLERLQQGQEPDNPNPPRQSSGVSLPDSIPTTTASGCIFEVGNESIPRQLAAIAELGSKEHWLIDASDVVWKPDKLLGMGGFGVVVPGVYLGLKVAVKVPKHRPGTRQSSSALVELCNELRIMRQLCHPNIVLFFGACVGVEFNDIALVMEQVTSALHYLHVQTPRIVHGDLKDSNIFVQRGGGEAGMQQSGLWGPSKLLDFGLARQITKSARPLGGSLRWVAPEAMQGGRPRTPADIFSLGRVAFFVVAGVKPGENKSDVDILSTLHKGKVLELNWPSSNSFADKYQDMVHQCSLKDPDQRPQIDGVRGAFTKNWRECADLERGPEGTDADLHAKLQAVRRAAAMNSHQTAKAGLKPRAKEGEGGHPTVLAV